MVDRRGKDRAGTLAGALRVLLRPLVRVLIARGLTAPDFYRLVKALYIEVADREFRLGGDRPTDSRLSILTGVHRKEVRALRDAESDGRGTGALRASPLATVVGRWLARPDLTDADGQPIALPRQVGAGPSFDALVASVSKDVRPRTVLDELNRQGLVRIGPDDDVVRLETGAVLGATDPAERLHFFAHNLADHTAAAADNLLEVDPERPRLERAVFYNRLTPEAVDVLEAMAREEASRLLRKLNAAALERQGLEAAREEAIERFRFGVYFYRATDDEPGGGTPRPGEPREAERDDQN